MSTLRILRRLLPGESYDTTRPVIFASLTAEANGLDRVAASADNAAGAVTPYYAASLLADWERVLGLTPADGATYQQRQQRVLSKLAETGGLSIPYFTRLAANLGYTITINEPQPFRAGTGRAGDRLWVKEVIWMWRVDVSNARVPVYRFRAGSSTAGERLTSFSDPVIEAIFNDLKPAHTFCWFAYLEKKQ